MMKAKSCSTWMGLLLITTIFIGVSCSNAQKKKEQVMQKKNMEQTMDTVTFIETETLVEVDSIVMDSVSADSNHIKPSRTSMKME